MVQGVGSVCWNTQDLRMVEISLYLTFFSLTACLNSISAVSVFLLHLVSEECSIGYQYDYRKGTHLNGHSSDCRCVRHTADGAHANLRCYLLLQHDINDHGVCSVIAGLCLPRTGSFLLGFTQMCNVDLTVKLLKFADDTTLT